MGVKGLFPYIRKEAGKSIEEKPEYLKHYVGRTVGIDASMWLYQFMAAVRTGSGMQNLANANGEATSHIQGFANRVLKMLEAGVKPIFVFDGPSPRAKEATLRVRSARKREAEEAYKNLPADATSEDVYKAASATTRVTRQHNSDVKTLLRLMGVAVVEAPGEAEATCAHLAKQGLVYGAVTEDMDALTFGAPVVIKNLFDVEGSRARSSKPAYEINLSKVLTGLRGSRHCKNGIDMPTFVDFCILCGCDYLEHLSGVGPATAFQLVDKKQNLESATRRLPPTTQPEEAAPEDDKDDDPDDDDEDEEPKKKKKKVTRKKAIGDDGRAVIAADWDFAAARRLFLTPDVTAEVPKPPTADYDGLVRFLVDTHGFNPDRVAKVVARLKKCKAAKPQQRLDAFLKPKTEPKVVIPQPAPAPPKPPQTPDPKPAPPQCIDLTGPEVTTTPASTTPASPPATKRKDTPPTKTTSPSPKKKPKTTSPSTTTKKKPKVKLAKPKDRITNWFKPASS